MRRRVEITSILAAAGMVLTAGWLLVPGVIAAWPPTAVIGWYAATMIVPGALSVWALRRAITDGLEILLPIDDDTDWNDLVADGELEGLEDTEKALREWFPTLVLGVFGAPSLWLAVTGLAAIVPPPASNSVPYPFAIALAGGCLCALVLFERRLR
ncbi:hypothetical protein [Natrarchaeobaculum aegyptiacum]|uniref:Uncharacterized protein n=1 Tax=Natrarchaeobaculum aegyptiacum TaxID=745377 RepID=A0A2Z2HV93_9EURY|nr:hypothetical protein [Natrarchaeobaculum aegyptiacum]ARS89447.1 hypothetical protein B1756_06605 [Natrarchaeobaculum aegyptiacum]